MRLIFSLALFVSFMFFPENQLFAQSRSESNQLVKFREMQMQSKIPHVFQTLDIIDDYQDALKPNFKNTADCWNGIITRAANIRTDSVALGWMQEYGSNSMPSIDQFSGMSVDSVGNVYVTGTGDFEWLTLKYSSTGTLLWNSQYVESGIIDTYGEEILVDSVGNVYVTGYRWGPFIDSDILLIKYDSEGNELWVSEFAGAAGDNDFPTTLKMDASGNILIGGYSYNADHDADFVTIKFDSDGNQLWTALFNGTGYANDWIIDMAIDGADNVYVGGVSRGEYTDDDYAILKYNSAGENVWVSGYDAEINNVDWLTGLAIDSLGQVYASGVSVHYEGYLDYLTLKLNPDGSEAWTQRYNGSVDGDNWSSDIVVDQNLNVTVTGVSFAIMSGFDFVTIQYDSTGLESWQARYTSILTYGYDEATTMLIDGNGDIVVTGISESANGTDDFVTLKYDSLGVEQWLTQFHGGDDMDDVPFYLAIDDSAGISVAGRADSPASAENFSVVQYTSSGTESWNSQYDGPGNSRNTGTIVANDAESNVIMAGVNYSPATKADFSLIKYDSIGTVEWISEYNGTADLDDIPLALTTDPAGNIIVTGYTENLDTDRDMTTIKYSPDGTQLWVAIYDGPASGLDESRAITTDSEGNIYITGFSSGTLTNYDYTTIKYDALGTEVWVARFVGPNYGSDVANDIIIDSDHNVYVTGGSFRAGMNQDYATIKYDAAGNEVWVSRYNGPINFDDIATAIRLDSGGSVYVTGTSTGSNISKDYATIRYSPNGVELWVARYDGTANFDDEALDLVIDRYGRSVVSGSSYGLDSGMDFVTIKYDALGEIVWQVRFNGSGNGDDTYGAMIGDGVGNIYVTGQTSSISGGMNYATLKYDSDGDLIWTEEFSGSGYSWDESADIAVDSRGTVWVTGTSHYFLLGDYDWSRAMTLQYLQPEYPVSTMSVFPQEFILEQNFPNPFNPYTTIRYSLAVQSVVTLRIFDLLGQEVITLKDTQQAAGYYQLAWDGFNQSGHKVNTGVYFCRLETANFSQTIKMVYLQ